jgi:hypothetical protein
MWLTTTSPGILKKQNPVPLPTVVNSAGDGQCSDGAPVQAVQQ